MDYSTNWNIQNKMTLNETKTKIVNISSQNSWRPNPILTSEYNFVKNLKLLGITLSEKWNWETHINNIEKTCS